jgi:phosphohistidine phosphatase
MEHDLMLVGHLPHLQLLVSKLLCGDLESLGIEFVSSAMLSIRRAADGRWHLCWMVTPQLLSAAGTDRA